MKRLVLLLALSAPFATAPAQGQDAEAATPIEIGERRSMYSEVLDEERAYWVYLPASYEQEPYAPKSYPVMYLLDGNAHFHSVTGVVDFMSRGINANLQIPEMIVVAIPNTNRARDLTPTANRYAYDGTEVPGDPEGGGGDAFLEFIRDELMPTIEAEYRTRPYEIIVGHSLGGLLALHALVNHPGMFDAVIAIDPSLWWDNRKLERQARSYFDEATDLEGAVFISLANNPPPPGQDNIMKIAGEAFAGSMKVANSRSFRTDHRYYEREDHGSVPLMSLYDGLLHIFDGYRPSLTDVFDDPSTLGEHFAAFSERIGMEFLPPESIVNRLGYALLQEDAEKAIVLFEMNAENYPESYNTFDSLGDGYAALEETEKAIASYERALELNPESEGTRSKLERLRSR